MVRSQQDTAALPASRPFAEGQAGYDYFADEQHYRSLADRVLAGLRQGGRIVLVTGDPPVNLSSLAPALTEATAGKQPVLAIACGGEFNEQELCRRPFTAHFVPSGGEAVGWTARKTLQLSGLGRQPPRRRAPGRAWLGPSARKAPAEPVRRRACDPLQLLRARPR